MIGTKAGCTDNGWIQMDSGILRPKTGVRVDGQFRMVVDAGGGMPAFDTGWLDNTITYKGVWSILGRFSSDPDDIGTNLNNFTLDSLTYSYIDGAPSHIAMGWDTSSPEGYDYFTEDGLLLEIEYANSNTRPAVNSWILTGAPKSSGRLLERKLILSANVAAGVVCAVGTDQAVSELGLFDGHSSGQMYAAAQFPYITIAGAQTFTVFYSIGISQT